MEKTLREVIKETIFFLSKEEKRFCFWSMSYCCWLGWWNITTFNRKRWNG